MRACTDTHARGYTHTHTHTLTVLQKYTCLVAMDEK